jgi:hypothetical protein
MTFLLWMRVVLLLPLGALAAFLVWAVVTNRD